MRLPVIKEPTKLSVCCLNDDINLTKKKDIITTFLFSFFIKLYSRSKENFFTSSLLLKRSEPEGVNDAVVMEL